jgi:tetratricopeptide (TPR) repeat protein
MDPNDVEANFNLASLYYQTNDEEKALKHYKKCVKKDEAPDGQYSEIKSLFAEQFAKAYFNAAIILDRQGDISSALKYYQKSFNKQNQFQIYDECYLKTATNLAVCYEKLGFREEALAILEKLKNGDFNSNKGTTYNLKFSDDTRLNNNLGVIYKRSGDYTQAQKCFEQAIF